MTQSEDNGVDGDGFVAVWILSVQKSKNIGHPIGHFFIPSDDEETEACSCYEKLVADDALW